MAERYFRTDSLSVGYNGKALIHDIDISVEKGEIVTLIGPNGSGKSTILKSITRQLKLIGGRVWIESEELDRNGMVVDFSELKRVVKGALDHRFVNEVVDFNPTAENLARWLCERIPNCYKVSIRESEHNEATYERDE